MESLYFIYKYTYIFADVCNCIEDSSLAKMQQVKVQNAAAQ